MNESATGLSPLCVIETDHTLAPRTGPHMVDATRTSFNANIDIIKYMNRPKWLLG